MSELIFKKISDKGDYFIYAGRSPAGCILCTKTAYYLSPWNNAIYSANELHQILNFIDSLEKRQNE